jgi:hypothetical protein
LAGALALAPRVRVTAPPNTPRPRRDVRRAAEGPRRDTMPAPEWRWARSAA